MWKHLASYSTGKREMVSKGEKLNTIGTYHVEVGRRADDPPIRIHPTLVKILSSLHQAVKACDGLMLLRRAEVVFNMVSTAATSMRCLVNSTQIIHYLQMMFIHIDNIVHWLCPSQLFPKV
jgi:hypothetical protein